MPEVLELNRASEETIEGLQRLLAVLEQGYEQLETASSQLEADNEALSQTIEVTAHLETLEQNLQEGEEGLETIETELIEEWEELQETMTEAVEVLEGAIQSIEEIHSIYEEFANTTAEFDAEFVDVENTFTEMVDGINQVGEALEESIEDTREIFSGMDQELTALQEKVESFSGVNADFDELINELSETHQEEVEASFDVLSTELSQEQTSEIERCFDATETEMTRLLNEFERDIGDMAQQLAEGHSDFFLELIHALESELGEKMKAAVEEATGEATIEIIAQVDATIALMAIGVATTPTLLRLLPTIIWARDAVEDANNFLDMALA